jgi:hypothetical protein
MTRIHRRFGGIRPLPYLPVVLRCPLAVKFRIASPLIAPTFSIVCSKSVHFPIGDGECESSSASQRSYEETSAEGRHEGRHIQEI